MNLRRAKDCTKQGNPARDVGTGLFSGGFLHANILLDTEKQQQQQQQQQQQ